VGKIKMFRKKCAYCGTKIEKGEEVFRDVRTPGFIGTEKKAFISEEHADKYGKEVEEYLKKPKQGGGCCG
jgi:hypothetical protein